MIEYQEEIQRMLDRWNNGDPVKSLTIGHTERHERDQALKLISIQRLPQRQELVHEYVFSILEHCLVNGVPEHEFFLALCDEELYPNFVHDSGTLTTEEREGAESFAWIVLHRGWEFGIEGHPDRKYIEVQRGNPNAHKPPA